MPFKKLLFKYSNIRRLCFLTFVIVGGPFKRESFHIQVGDEK